MHLVYLLRCADDSLYTGYTTDLDRRLRQHNAGTGAKYTRARRPVTVEAAWEFPSKGAALSAEHRIRNLPRTRKLELIAGSILPPDLASLGPVKSPFVSGLQEW